MLERLQIMGAIKDIVDLAKDLESRAKDRKDMDTIHKIQSLAFSLQSQHADVIERDVRLMEENAKLKQELTEAQAEEIRIQNAIEFRRGKRTGGVWMPFCPRCKMPARLDLGIFCSGECGWNSDLSTNDLPRVIAQLK
jgi:hypothetical protein